MTYERYRLLKASFKNLYKYCYYPNQQTHQDYLNLVNATKDENGKIDDEVLAMIFYFASNSVEKNFFSHAVLIAADEDDKKEINQK